jgi:hypothetical protein
VIISSAVCVGAASKANVIHASPHQETRGVKAAVEPIDLLGYKQHFAHIANPMSRRMQQQQQVMDHAANADSNVDMQSKIRKTTDTSTNVPPFLNRPMRPQSAMKYYMKHLTDFEHQEIFDYSEVSI